jgi:tetratricopeptide (TPR) repeat protein
VLGALTWQRNRDYLSEEGIWRDTVAKLPQNERAHNNLGFVLSTSPGAPSEAIAQYEEASGSSPGIFEAHNNLGNALESLGRTGGDRQYAEALRLEPDLAEAHYNLGIARWPRCPGGG